MVVLAPELGTRFAALDAGLHLICFAARQIITP
jgi:hypothetical protein